MWGTGGRALGVETIYEDLNLASKLVYHVFLSGAHGTVEVVEKNQSGREEQSLDSTIVAFYT